MLRRLVISLCGLLVLVGCDPKAASSIGDTQNLNRIVVLERCQMTELGESFHQIVPKGRARDNQLLAEAVLHFANIARCQNGLPRLFHDDAIMAVATSHSAEMAALDFFDHVSNTPGRNTPLERVQTAGIPVSKVNENIIQEYFIQYKSGEPFITIDESACLYSYGPLNAPMPRHTYFSLAETLIKRWLDSPGHRRNLLDPDVTLHGFGMAETPDQTLCGSLVATQVMLRPPA